eukprot:757094-Hanusia_phi.AAC.2
MGPAQLKNSMNGYEDNGSMYVRDAVLDTPSFGSAFSSPAQLAKYAAKYVVCCNQDRCFEFFCGRLICSQRLLTLLFGLIVDPIVEDEILMIKLSSSIMMLEFSL